MEVEETSYQVHRWLRNRFVRVFWGIPTIEQAEADVAKLLAQDPKQQLRIVRRTERVILVTPKVPA